MSTKTDPTQNNDLRFYTTAEVAAMLNLTERQVSRARQAGKLVGTRFTGSAVRHNRAQIDAWIAASTTAAK